MNCNDIRELLSEYLDDRLEQARRREIAAHIDSCVSCREELSALRKTVDLVRGLPYVPAPANLADGIFDSTIRPGARKTVLRPGIQSWMPVMRGVAAAAVIVIFAYMGHSFIEKESRSRAPEPRMAETPAAEILLAESMDDSPAERRAAVHASSLDSLGALESGKLKDSEEQGAWGSPPEKVTAPPGSTKSDKKEADNLEQTEHDAQYARDRAVLPEGLQKEDSTPSESKPESARKDLAAPPAASGPLPSGSPAPAPGAAPQSPSPRPSGGFAGGGSFGSGRGGGAVPEARRGHYGDSRAPKADAKAGKDQAAARDLPMTLIIRSSDSDAETLKVRKALERSSMRMRSAEKEKQEAADPADDAGAEKRAAGSSAPKDDLEKALRRLESRDRTASDAKEPQLESGSADKGKSVDAGASRPGTAGFEPPAPETPGVEEYVVRVSFSEYSEFKKALMEMKAPFEEKPSTAYMGEITRTRRANRPQDKGAPEQAEDAKGEREKARGPADAAAEPTGAGAPADAGPYVLLTIRIVREHEAQPPATAPKADGPVEKPQSGSSGNESR